MGKTMSPPDLNVSTDGQTDTIHMPLTLRRIGGRKRVISPPGASAWMPPRPEINSPLLHALVRAFHWQSLFDNGHYASVNELAKAHRRNASYVAAILRLTLLASATAPPGSCHGARPAHRPTCSSSQVLAFLVTQTLKSPHR